MNVRALKYVVIETVEGPFRSALPADRAQELDELRQAPGASVFLVESAALGRFRPMTDLVLDRGRKNPHKGLAAYFAGCPPAKIPLVEGAYSSRRSCTGASVISCAGPARSRGAVRRWIRICGVEGL